MSPLPKIIVYKTIDCDVEGLQRECARIGYDFYVFDNPEDFKREIDKGSVVAIIVPLGSTNDGNIILKFCETTENILRPEDADVLIIYSTEKFTPDSLPQNIDPRPVKNYENSPKILTEDIKWQETIKALELLRKEINLVSNSVPNCVEVKVLGKSEVPFPIEAVFLLRAAFKDMSKIVIDFPPKQGLSGSIVCEVQPFDKDLNKCEPFFAKIYQEREKANTEISNLKYIGRYMAPEYYAHHQIFKVYEGHVFAILVTDLVKGPKNRPLSFYKMLQSSKYSVGHIKSLIRKAFSVLEKFPKTRAEEKIDLCKEYLGFLSENPPRERMLRSENICRRWFGNIKGPTDLLEKIKAALPPRALESLCWRVCHGDLHSENIMVKEMGGKLGPSFIDYYHVGYQHGIKDLVVLEVDIVIRGLEEIDVISFLDSLEGKVKRLKLDKRHLLVAQKSAVAIKELRKKASSYGVSEIEYFGACLLRTLFILSYGKLPFHQNQTADLYVKYLLGKIKKLSEIQYLPVQ